MTIATQSQSRVLTLVFTDLAGSTALKTERGDRTVGELIRRHREHVTELASHCGGRIIDWAGDGCFLTFETSSAAVTFALRLQQVHHYESDLPGVRVGVHMGEVSERPMDGTVRVEGLIVDLSARISGLAIPGQVLISNTVQQSAKQRLGIHEFGQPIRWETYGAYTLKGFDEPVDIREAGLENISPFVAPEASEKAWPANAKPDNGATPAANPNAPIRKLAVLPFANLSGDEKQNYFVDGMTEAIITELAKIKALRVISRTSVMRYRNTTQSLLEIAEELNVQALVEGSVLRAGNDVRITAQLIRGDSDEHLWAEHYDGTVDNVLKLQKDIALSIADEIQVAVTSEERARISKAPRIDPDLYDQLLKSMRFGGDWSPKSLRQSIEVAREIQRRSPKFAPAHMVEGVAHSMMGVYGYEESVPAFRRARAASRRALALDENSSGAQTVLGWVAFQHEWDWDEAERRLRIAGELEPNNPWVYMGLGCLYAILGRFGDALEIVVKATEVDPNGPPAHHSCGIVAFLAEKLDVALGHMANSLVASNKAIPTYIDGTAIAAYAGDHALARHYIEEAIRLAGPQPQILAFSGYAYARAGESKAAEEVLRQLTADDSGLQTLHTGLALLLTGLGRHDDAIRSLEISYQRNEPLFPWFMRCPFFSELRPDPRFQALVNKLDLPSTHE